MALAAWHAAGFYTHPGRTVYGLWACYYTDLARLCRGEVIDLPDDVQIERPAKAIQPMSYESFRKLVRALDNQHATEAKLGRRGRRKKWGGGGASTEVTKVFELVMGDDTQFANWYLIDGDRNVAAGLPTVMLTFDVLTKTFPGWHVDCGPPSRTTLMRAILHSAKPKIVPPRFRERYPELADIGGRVSCYMFDNALQNVARGTEDMAGDTCSEVSWAGEDQPSHKNEVERHIQTIQSLLSKELHSHALDIRTMRELNLEPSVKAVVTIDTFRILLDEAIATYHVTGHDGLGGMTPLQAFIEAAARDGVDIVSDLDEFEMAIGDVEYDVTFERTGFSLEEAPGLRFSDFELTPILFAEELSLGKHHGKQKNKVKVKVKWLPDDLSCAFLWSQFRNEYVRIPCTKRHYAAGLPVWLHKRIRDFATSRSLPFNTEAEQIEARAGLIELVRSVSREASEAEKRLKARILSSPAVRSVLGSVVDVVRTPASPSGREVVVEHDVGIDDREDRFSKPPRRQRGSEKNDLDDDRAFADLMASEPNAVPRSPNIAREPSSPSGRETAGKPGRKKQDQTDTTTGSKPAGEPQQSENDDHQPAPSAPAASAVAQTWAPYE